MDTESTDTKSLRCVIIVHHATGSVCLTEVIHVAFALTFLVLFVLHDKPTEIFDFLQHRLCLSHRDAGIVQRRRPSRGVVNCGESGRHANSCRRGVVLVGRTRPCQWIHKAVWLWIPKFTHRGLIQIPGILKTHFTIPVWLPVFVGCGWWTRSNRCHRTRRLIFQHIVLVPIG